MMILWKMIEISVSVKKDWIEIFNENLKKIGIG